VIFTWHAPTARQIALRVKGNSDVWAGGPGLFRLDKWWTEQTGLKAHHGLDQRFERQRGNYLMTFASRGCPGMGPVEQPKPCSFCIVWRLEGINFTLDWDFHPAPVLCDNNLSALPVDFQEHIIRRYQETETPLKDANSGFEPHTFDEGTYRRWKPILKGAWRFAFDTWEEAPALERMMTKVLKDEPARKKQVYVLAGNEEIQSCYERAQKVIEWGGEPYCQIVRPLDWLGGPHPMKFNWTEQLGRDFMRFYNSRAHIWRNTDLRDYRPRTNDAPPFKRILTVRREAA
jgi:hypothetical protein